MRTLTEQQISERLYRYIKEGEKTRQTGEICPYAGNTIAHMLHVIGWSLEDLRQGLMRADPDGYGAEQKRFEAAGVFK